MRNNSFISIVAIALLPISFLVADVESIGVCYSRMANNLPPIWEVINLYKSNSIGGIRLYGDSHDAIAELQGSNIAVIINIRDPSPFASDPLVASKWVQNHIQAFPNVNFRYIAVGYELIPSLKANDILPAMKNFQNALKSAGLQNRIKISTSISTLVLDKYNPPSAGVFSLLAVTTLQPIVSFLASNGAPLLVNVFPYFNLLGDPAVSLDYALFTSPGTVVYDGQLQYQNLFDAIVDALYSALEKIGGGSVPIVVSETGWPSAGGAMATQQNAQTYLSNLIKHVGHGTPKRPGIYIDTYIFTMFDENLKPQGMHGHFGLFTASKQPKYSLSF